MWNRFPCLNTLQICALLTCISLFRFLKLSLACLNSLFVELKYLSKHPCEECLRDLALLAINQVNIWTGSLGIVKKSRNLLNNSTIDIFKRSWYTWYYYLSLIVSNIWRKHEINNCSGQTFIFTFQVNIPKMSAIDVARYQTFMYICHCVFLFLNAKKDKAKSIMSSSLR